MGCHHSDYLIRAKLTALLTLPSNINLFPVIKIFHFTGRGLQQHRRWFSCLFFFICSIFSIWTAEGKIKKRDRNVYCRIHTYVKYHCSMLTIEHKLKNKVMMYFFILRSQKPSSTDLTALYIWTAFWVPLLEFHQRGKLKYCHGYFSAHKTCSFNFCSTENALFRKNAFQLQHSSLMTNGD